jgi:hypothetical protein
LPPGISGLPVVVGDLIGIGPGRLLQNLADTAVPRLMERGQHISVERLANEGVDEAELLPVWGLLYEVRLQGAPEHVSQAVVARAAHRAQQSELHLLADHRSDSQ